MIEDKRPWSECPSVWDVYWDMSCGNEVDACSAIWERKYVSPRQLRELARSEGYMPDKIAQVLKEGPSRVRSHDERRTADSKLGYQPPEDRNFEMWERHGEVTRAQLLACKCRGVEEATEENGLDELDAISATLVFVNETPIKAFLNPLESGEMIYDFFQWEKQENSLAGFGVPYLLRQASQRMVTAATRMLMDNSGRSAGPQVVVRRGLVEPANKRWEITGNKLWFMKEDGASVKDVFGVYQIGTNTADYMAIIQLALKFADEEISLPMIMAGEKGSAPSQVGSMQMLMNSATVVLRRLVKRFDGQITRRHIRRYYDYNMQFNPKSEIKGDYEVDARGSTALMQRDLANQGLQKWLAALTNQALAIYFDAEKMIRKSLQADYIVPDDVMAETAEIKQRLKAAAESKPQPSPDAMVRAEAQVKAAEMAGAAKAGETQARLEDAERDRQHELLLKAIDSDLTVKELAAEEGINLENVKKDLAKAAMQIRAARESFLEEVALKQATGSGI
jgi:cytidylate kinase